MPHEQKEAPVAAEAGPQVVAVPAEIKQEEQEALDIRRQTEVAQPVAYYQPQPQIVAAVPSYYTYAPTYGHYVAPTVVSQHHAQVKLTSGGKI